MEENRRDFEDIDLEYHISRKSKDEDHSFLIRYLFERIIFYGFTIRHVHEFIRNEYFYDNIVDIVFDKFGKYLSDLDISKYKNVIIRRFIYDYIEKDPLIANGFMFFYINEYIQMYGKYSIEDKGYDYYMKNISDEDVLLSPHIYNISLLDYRYLNHVLFSRLLLSSSFINIIKRTDPYVLNYVYRKLGKDIFQRITETDIWLLEDKIGFLRTAFFGVHLAASINNYRERVKHSI